MANPDLAPGALAKPAKGSHLIERKQRRQAIVSHEDREKEKVRRRDVKCIWPNCEDCRRYKPRLECAHGKAKGIGGDHGERSNASDMSLVCFLVHQGPKGMHQGYKRIRPLNKKLGHNGPRACEERETNDGKTPWVLVGMVGL